MDILNNILIAAHLMGLVLLAGSGIALAVVAPLFGQIGEEKKGLVFGVAKTLARNGHIGLGLLWVTGLLVVWLKYGGIGGFDTAFWIKMALVVILSASAGMGSAAFRRFTNGDVSASGRVAMFGRINSIVGPLTVLAAVFAFS